mmetsp:Transcript_2733/g.2586  ORF Transcript_2733/g.2586 Transcript_2733/m.2586 type:complete len:148 (+) Transcript_2733:193-636(+)
MGHCSSLIPQLNNDQAMDIGMYAIDKIGGRIVSFEEEDGSFKKQVAEIFAAKKEFDKAARLLEKINLENTNRNILEDEKVDVFVQIAEHWFEDQDAVNAEKFINKAAHYVHMVRDQGIVLRYKVCHSRIMDSKRKFIVAASSYYDLS